MLQDRQACARLLTRWSTRPQLLPQRRQLLLQGLVPLLGLLQTAGENHVGARHRPEGSPQATTCVLGPSPRRPLPSPLSPQLGLLCLRQPLLQALLGPDLSLQR